MDEKKCPRCGETKPLSEFSKNKSRSDGHAHYCKSCAYAATKQWVSENNDKRKESKRNAYWKNPDRERSIAARRRRENPETNRKACARYNDAHPERRNAVNVVNRAVAAGDICPPTNLKCAACGMQAKDYHHASYAPEHWLFVVPLCRSCHKRVHTGAIALEVELP